MQRVQQMWARDPEVTELLARVAVRLMVEGQQTTPSAEAEVALAPASPGDQQSRHLTVRADQVKVVGAGRRPASLSGRQVTVTLVATVVAEHENGTLSVTIAEADLTAHRPRAKRSAMASRRSTSKVRGRSVKKRSGGQRVASKAKEGTA